jgi:arginine exporter protein ArgO
MSGYYDEQGFYVVQATLHNNAYVRRADAAANRALRRDCLLVMAGNAALVALGVFLAVVTVDKLLVVLDGATIGGNLVLLWDNLRTYRKATRL